MRYCVPPSACRKLDVINDYYFEVFPAVRTTEGRTERGEGARDIRLNRGDEFHLRIFRKRNTMHTFARDRLYSTSLHTYPHASHTSRYEHALLHAAVLSLNHKTFFIPLSCFPFA